MLRDLALALRRLRNAPSFAIVAILTLALGIGANTVVFTAVDSVLLRRLPVHDPEALFSLHEERSNAPNTSYPNYLDIRDRNDVLSGLIGARLAPIHLSQGGSNARLWGYLVTGNYFDVLGVKPVLGRTFGPSDDVARGGHPVAVLSHGCWQRMFGADPGVAGKTAKINGLDYTILGVMPAGFFGTEVLLNADVWVPIAMQKQVEPGNDWLDARGTRNLWVLGRLKPGVSREQAEAGLAAVTAQMARESPNNEGPKYRLVAPGLFGNLFRGPVAGGGAALLALSALVLLLACVNLAGLLLARALARRREIAVCLAIGADRARLVRQMLTESLLLAVAASLTALAFTFWAYEALSAWRPPVDLMRNDLRVSGSVLWFGFGAALATTLLFGLLPAFQATRISLASAIHATADADLGRRKLRDWLMAGQVALSVFLLVATVLVVRSLQSALVLPLGFEPSGAVTVSFNAALQGFDQPRVEQLRERLLDKARALPGAVSAGAADNIPLSIGNSTTTVRIEGKPEPPPSKRASAVYYFVSPGYFATMRTRLLAGREFEPRDRRGAPPAVIVNQAFARRYMDDDRPLGKRVRFMGQWSNVVGVVETGKYETLSDESQPVIFGSILQRFVPETALILRTRLPAEQAVDQLRRLVAEEDASLPLYQAGPLASHLEVHLFRLRAVAGFLGVLGLLAVALAATGIYGALSYAVARRRREIGIRIAVGALPSQVASLVLRRAMALVGAGALVGVAAAGLAAPLFAPLLAGVGPRDPASFGVALAAILTAGGLAAWRPARAALAVDPIHALRQD